MRNVDLRELLGLVAQDYNLNTWESRAVGLPQVPGQCGVLGNHTTYWSVRTMVM